MKSNLHRCRLGKRVATISMAWRAETPCGAFGFGHCGWNGKLAAIRYRLQGREWSAATGLTNFRMRWYDSVTGRWLSKDPIGLSGGLNLYAFCGNNPICRIDVYGTLSSAFWAPQGIGFGSQQVVTHFSASAQTSLKAGDWVMTGGNTFRNWLMAGAPEKVGVWGSVYYHSDQGHTSVAFWVGMG